MKQKDVQTIARSMAPVIRELVGQQLEPLKTQLAELEAREHELKYTGVWQPPSLYHRGNFATFDSSVWHANRDTRAKPGTSDDWTLAVKRGKDGGR